MKRRDFLGVAFALAIIPAAVAFSATKPLVALWPDQLPQPHEGIPYSFKLKASGGIPPYTFSTDNPSLLKSLGLSLNPRTGEIHGTVKRLKKNAKRNFGNINFSVTDSAS